jgi:hypothetical protein
VAEGFEKFRKMHMKSGINKAVNQNRLGKNSIVVYRQKNERQQHYRQTGE